MFWRDCADASFTMLFVKPAAERTEPLSCRRVLPLLSNMCVECVFVSSNLIQRMRAEPSATSCQSSHPSSLRPPGLPWRVFRFSTCNNLIWWWKGRGRRCCWVNSGAFTSHHVSRGLCGLADGQNCRTRCMSLCFTPC